MTNSKFNSWINRFIEEKNIDLETTCEFDNHNGFNIMPYGVVIEFMKNMCESDQAKIKNKLIEIDFKNGKVENFLEYMAKAI